VFVSDEMLHDGFTLAGTLHVKDMDLLPILVLPLYVSQYNVPTPEVAFGTICARSRGGVHDTLVLEDFVHIVPDFVPYKYVMVCVKLVLARDTEIVPALPIVRVPHEMEDARGITLRENVLLLLLLIAHS
jgi:hypothetical protein